MQLCSYQSFPTKSQYFPIKNKFLITHLQSVPLMIQVMDVIHHLHEVVLPFLFHLFELHCVLHKVMYTTQLSSDKTQAQLNNKPIINAHM